MYWSISKERLSRLLRILRYSILKKLFYTEDLLKKLKFKGNSNLYATEFFGNFQKGESDVLIIAQSVAARQNKHGLQYTIINNEFNLLPAQKRRTDARRVRKMTPRAPQIFLISSARRYPQPPQPPQPPQHPFSPLSSFLFPLRNVFYAPARSYTHITCLHSGLSRKSCSTGAFFFFSLLSGPLSLSLSLSLSFSTSLEQAPFPARSGPGFSPVAYMYVHRIFYTISLARHRYSSTSNS